MVLSPGHVRWFGVSWGAPVCEAASHIPVPEGQDCVGCGYAFEGGENGLALASVEGGFVAYHLGCWLRAIGAAVTQEEP